jgi:hypothetical protein
MAVTLAKEARLPLTAPATRVASADPTIDHDMRGWHRRQGAPSLNGNDRPTAVVEGGRDLEGEATLERDRELATEIVNAVPDGPVAPHQDCLDLQDVDAHRARIADEATTVH